MQLQIPTSRTFLLTLSADGDLVRADPSLVAGDNTVSISFRQGTTQEDAERTNWMNRRKYMYDDKVRQMVEVAELNPDDLERLEARLSMTDCDLKLPDGSPISFKEELGVRRVANLVQFDAWWGLLPTQWAGAIYECCLEVNPDWGNKRPE